MATFHTRLSQRTVRARYGHDRSLAERTAHERLARICFVDYNRQFALVAEAQVLGGATEIAGVARLSRIHATNDRQLTLTVADAWQRQGIGAALVHCAVRVSRGEGVERVIAELAPDNTAMRELLDDEGFVFEPRDGTIVATLTN